MATRARKRIIRRVKGNETPGLAVAGAPREPQVGTRESDMDSDEYVPRDDSFSEGEPLDLPSTPQFLNRHRRKRPRARSNQEEDIWSDTGEDEDDEVTFPRQKAAEVLQERALDGQTEASGTVPREGNRLVVHVLDNKAVTHLRDIRGSELVRRPHRQQSPQFQNRLQWRRPSVCGQEEEIRNNAGEKKDDKVSFPRQKAAEVLQECDLHGQTEASVTAPHKGNRLVVQVQDDNAVMHLRDIQGREPVRRPRRQQSRSHREHPALLTRSCKRGT